MKRAQNKIKRILLLVDALAQRRMPFTIQDAMDALSDRSGGDIEVCYRTVQRDMELLISMNFAEIYRKGESGRAGSSGIVTQYKMNIVLTRNVQAAARTNTDGNQHH